MEGGDVTPDIRERSGRGRFWADPVHRQWIADGSLVMTTLIWGATFVVVKDIVARVDAVALVAVRFLMAAVVMVVAVAPRLRRMTPRLAGAGALVGLALFIGYAFQTMGLEHTSASKAGFITGLSVVLVPVLSAVILKRPPEPAAIVGVACATVGLALLTLRLGGAPLFEIGDILVLVGAVAFGLHIVAVGRFAPVFDVPLLVTVQLATVSIAAFVVLGVRVLGLGHHVAMPVSWCDLGGIAFLAVFGTTMAFFIQNVAQRFTSPTHVAIVFATEPVFAGVFGWLLLGERLTPAQQVGAALILAGMLASEVEFPWKARRAGPDPGR
ncbi:MAG: DMT family transporter [Bacillota bacterium]|nr:DMT family transporter [Bacillota bacterium]